MWLSEAVASRQKVATISSSTPGDPRTNAPRNVINLVRKPVLISSHSLMRCSLSLTGPLFASWPMQGEELSEAAVKGAVPFP